LRHLKDSGWGADTFAPPVLLPSVEARRKAFRSLSSKLLTITAPASGPVATVDVRLDPCACGWLRPVLGDADDKTKE
jgi:hypothetical protein